MELKELLSDFSLKPFVRPTPTTQSHYRNAPSADGRSASLVPKAALRDAPRLTTSDLELNQLISWLLLVLQKMCY